MFFSVVQMCVEHDNTCSAVLDGKHWQEETSVLSVSVKDLFMDKYINQMTE